MQEVLDRLDHIVRTARDRGSRMGYFPALYRTVTRDVQRRCNTDFFEDPVRMRSMTVAFANRYLRAYENYTADREVPRPWEITFRATGRWRPIVIQHLLLGMNAHINYDLSLATIQTVPARELGDFHDDFQRITDLLGDLVDGVQERLSAVWFSVRLLDWMGQRLDETIMNFSLKKARNHAWNRALQLAGVEGPERENIMGEMERRTTLLAGAILHPGFSLSGLSLAVRLGERQNVGEVVSLLAE